MPGDFAALLSAAFRRRARRYCSTSDRRASRSRACFVRRRPSRRSAARLAAARRRRHPAVGGVCGARSRGGDGGRHAIAPSRSSSTGFASCSRLSRVPFASTSITGSAVSPRGWSCVARRRIGGGMRCARAALISRTSSVSAPIAMRWSSHANRAAREPVGEEARALAFGELGRLHHADLGEQRDVDDKVELRCGRARARRTAD